MALSRIGSKTVRLVRKCLSLLMPQTPPTIFMSLYWEVLFVSYGKGHRYWRHRHRRSSLCTKRMFLSSFNEFFQNDLSSPTNGGSALSFEATNHRRPHKVAQTTCFLQLWSRCVSYGLHSWILFRLHVRAPFIAQSNVFATLNWIPMIQFDCNQIAVTRQSSTPL